MLSSEAGGREAFRTILFLFTGLRLVLLMVLPADTLFAYGDYQHYYNLAAWSVPGNCPAGGAACWPLIDYWYEFPPLFPYLSIALLRLVGGGSVPPFHIYAYALALVMLLADVGTFLLVHRVAERLYSRPTADRLAWVYALMPAPLILSWWTFDGLTTLWMMAGLWAVLARRDGLAALAVGLGTVTKFVPVLLLPAVWRARPLRRAAVITGGAAGVALLVLAPFLWRAPAVTLASLQAQAAKASYGTVWAMLDGNLRTPAGGPVTGNFGSLVEHFDLSRATANLHNAARVPAWLTLLAAGGAVLAVWRVSTGARQSQGVDGRRTLLWFAFTWAVFLLWSKGWSPQWQQMLVPVILLAHPNPTGVLLALALALVSFAEWPLLLSRGLAEAYYLTIPLRTGLILVWALVLGAELVRPKAEALL